jgi:transposase-like protein
MNCPFCGSKARNNGIRETAAGIKRRFLCKKCRTEGSQYTFYCAEEYERMKTEELQKKIEVRDTEIALGANTSIIV